MELKDQTDHIAILSLMMVGVLTRRLKELGQLDDETSGHLQKLIKTVRSHAEVAGINDLSILFENIDKSLG